MYGATWVVYCPFRFFNPPTTDLWLRFAGRPVSQCLRVEEPTEEYEQVREEGRQMVGNSKGAKMVTGGRYFLLDCCCLGADKPSSTAGKCVVISRVSTRVVFHFYSILFHFIWWAWNCSWKMGKKLFKWSSFPLIQSYLIGFNLIWWTCVQMIIISFHLIL